MRQSREACCEGTPESPERAVIVHLPTHSPTDLERFPPLPQIRTTSDGLAALGGDLRPTTIIEAYSKGLFPWEDIDPVPWFSPDPRCILRPSAFHASRSLRKLDRQGRYRVTADLRFCDVMRGCATTLRPGQRGTWIGERMIDAYTALHRCKVAHSIEVWEGDELVGGLYGLAIGSAFFGESMFSARPDASKLALFRLCRRLESWGFAFVDCQQETSHLRSLGATSLPRTRYLDLLLEARSEPCRWNPDKLGLLSL